MNIPYSCCRCGQALQWHVVAYQTVGVVVEVTTAEVVHTKCAVGTTRQLKL